MVSRKVPGEREAGQRGGLGHRVAVLVFGLFGCGSSNDAPEPRSEPSPYEIEEGMARVSAGTFIRGCSLEFEGKCENPRTVPWRDGPRGEVFLSEFWIDVYEVTKAEYTRCVELGRCTPALAGQWLIEPPRPGDTGVDFDPNDPTWPVTGLDWYQADAYCRGLGKRLPTESEWEKAARGTDGRLYPWGNRPPECGDAHYNIRGCPAHLDVPAPVGSHPADVSPYGAMDMLANVKEWTSDWASWEYASANAVDPQGPGQEDASPGRERLEEEKMVRGEYYDSSAWTLTARRSLPMYARVAIVGVRCASSVPPHELPPPVEAPAVPPAPPPPEPEPEPLQEGEPCTSSWDCESLACWADTMACEDPCVYTCQDTRAPPHRACADGDACGGTTPCYDGYCSFSGCHPKTTLCVECWSCVKREVLTPGSELVQQLHEFVTQIDDLTDPLRGCFESPGCTAAMECVEANCLFADSFGACSKECAEGVAAGGLGSAKERDLYEMTGFLTLPGFVFVACGGCR